MTEYTSKNPLRLLDGKVKLFRRENLSKNYIYEAKIGKKWVQLSARTDSLEMAKDIAIKSYYDKNAMAEKGEPIKENSFARVLAVMLEEEQVAWEIKDKPKNMSAMKDTRGRAKLVKEYFWDMHKLDVQDINYYRINEYIAWRKQRPKRVAFGWDPKQQIRTRTLEGDYIILRKLLKVAVRKGWIKSLPEFPKLNAVRNHRSWFSLQEYKLLIKQTNKHIKEAGKDLRKKIYAEDLRDWILFIAHTGCRVGEVKSIRIRDVKDVNGDGSNPNDFMYVNVIGKTGRREIVALYGAVKAYHRMKERHKLKPDDLLFEKSYRWQFAKLLKDTKGINTPTLRTDDKGNRRDGVSLRHFFIMARLLYGNVDVFDLATQCGNSVKIIQQFYARPLTPRMKTEQILRYRKFDPKKLLGSEKQTNLEGGVS